MAKTLMVQGTSSYAGKTLLVTALCRIFSREGYRVAPFKAQNMSLNSYVTPDGREIARAQALQAMAAGIEPQVEMNPILLKPTGDQRCQIVLMGRPFKEITAGNYYRSFALKDGIGAVKSSLEKLLHSYDMVIIEGAGSPAEPNLYERDIVNMKVAEITSSPVLLVGDIDRGGVFASIYGTLALLKPEHRSLVKGLIINKFRGDLSLLKPGIVEIERITKKPVLGVIPFLEGLLLPGEDSVSLDEVIPKVASKMVDIAVLRLPRISNLTDFDPLKSEVRYVKFAEELERPDALIIPGSKNVIEDLNWIRERGFDKRITELRKARVPIIGICGGFQMLGKKIIDLNGYEGGSPGVHDGLGLLDVETRFDEYRKITRRVVAETMGNGPLLSSAKGSRIRGYEVHMGTTRIGKEKPLFRITKGGEQHFDGTISSDGLVFGSYLHGIFDDPSIRNSFLTFLSSRKGYNREFNEASIDELRLKSIDTLAKAIEKSLDMKLIRRIIYS